MSTRTHGEGIATLLQGTADAMGELLTGHFKLAWLELMADATRIGRRAAAIACLAALGAIGYAFIALGIAAWLQPILGWPTALLMLGALQLVGGGLGVWWVLEQLKAIEALGRTVRAAGESVETLRAGEREQPEPEKERVV